MIDLDEELPEDIEDESIYVPVPHKYDLNLGKNLALTFAEEQLADSYDTVSNIFRQRGAYLPKNITCQLFTCHLRTILTRRPSGSTLPRYPQILWITLLTISDHPP